MSVNLFDVNFYRAANPDLAGLNDRQAISHFTNFGLNLLALTFKPASK